MGVDGVDFSPLENNSVFSSYGVVTTGSYDTGSAAADVLNISAEEKGFVGRFAYEISKHRCWGREMDGLTNQVAY
jgi:catalase